eukprot:715728-Rhodomonas_salina.1
MLSRNLVPRVPGYTCFFYEEASILASYNCMHSAHLTVNGTITTQFKIDWYDYYARTRKFEKNSKFDSKAVSAYTFNFCFLACYSGTRSGCGCSVGQERTGIVLRGRRMVKC